MEKKKILYLHQYFKTNKTNGGTRSYEFSKHFSTNNEVTVITGESIEEKLNGIKIKSTGTEYNQRMSFKKRIYSFLHYILKSIYLGIKEKNIDIIFATSTPITIGVPALILKKIKKSKLIFEVRDVWPDIPIELGFIKNKTLIKFLKWFELYIYKNSNQIIVASEGMYNNLIKKGVSKEKLSIITNLSNIYLYDKIRDEEIKEIKEKYDIKNKFICIHPGTIGFVNGLDYILDAAKKTKDKDILYLLVGDGKEKEKLKLRVKHEKIENVKIIDALPKLEIVKLIKASDLGLMITKKYKILEDNSANKFFDFLAAELPIIVNYNGWQKKVLEKNKVGFSSDAENAEDLYDKILKIRNSDKYILMKKNSRKLAEEYSTEKACIKLDEILNIV